EVTAAPSGHYQHSHAVGQIEKMIVFNLALQADGVQIHVQGVTHLLLHALVAAVQQHVKGPAAAANHNLFSIDFEQTVALLRELAGYLAYPKMDRLAIALAVMGPETENRPIEILSAEFRRPPQTRILDMKLRIPVRRKSNLFGLPCRQLHILGEMDLLDANFQRAFDGPVTAVPGDGVNYEISRVERLRVDLGVYKRMAYGDRTGSGKIGFAPQ